MFQRLRAAAGEAGPLSPWWQARAGGRWRQTGPMDGPAIARWRTGPPKAKPGRKPSSWTIQAHGWDRHAGTWQKAHPGQSYGDPGQKIHWDAPGKADLGHADWFPHRATTVSHLCGGRDLMSCNFLHKVMCIHLLGMLWLPILVLDKEL